MGKEIKKYKPRPKQGIEADLFINTNGCIQNKKSVHNTQYQNPNLFKEMKASKSDYQPHEERETPWTNKTRIKELT